MQLLLDRDEGRQAQAVCELQVRFSPAGIESILHLTPRRLRAAFYCVSTLRYYMTPPNR